MIEGEGGAAGKNQKQTEEEDRFGFIKWLYRWYKRYDTWSGRYDWFQWLLSMFKTHTATSLAITSGTAAVTVAAAVVVVNPDLRREYLPFFSAPAEAVQTQSWGSSVIYPIAGRDLEGRRATFDVAVLPQDLTWAQRSDRELDQGGTIIPNSQVADTVFTPELREGLGRSSAVIAVGLASQEGQIEVETARALRRATTAAGWLASISGEEKPIWVLNLGQFTGECEAAADNASTSWQRPLIVVGIRSQETDVRLVEAFADAISDKSNLPSKECYTSFDLTRYR